MNILFISLGCDKNLVDSEVMLGMLQEKGYSFTDDESLADGIVVNTCCFIGDAKEESINTILEMAELKKTGRLKALVVTGCLAQRYSEEIQKEIPEVDAILGTTAIEAIGDALEKVLGAQAQNTAEDMPENRAASRADNAPVKILEDLDKKPSGGKKRIITTGGYYDYLKIAEGCNKHCTYCIIPKVRGNYRSIPMEELVKEAKMLVQSGVRELILVAQETTLYGVDLYGKKMLPELLRRLCAIEELVWIRILYCYPEEITEELIEVIREEEKICNYLDIPVQSGSDAILRRMGRRTDSGQIREMIEKLRERIPDICIRTTLIAGFPGESEENHQETLAFVDELEFDRLGVFTYSPEEDTPAAEMPEQLSEEVKERRRDEIMELQQEIAFEAADRMVGRTVKAMIEGRMPEEDAYVARTYKDAPGVDGYLFINTDRQLLSGDFVNVRIIGSNEYDLIGELTEEE